MIQVKNKIVSGDFQNPGDFTYVLDDTEPRKGKKINFKYDITIIPYGGFKVIDGDYESGYIDIVKVKMPTEANGFIFMIYTKNRKTKRETIYYKSTLELLDQLYDNDIPTTRLIYNMYNYLNQLGDDFESTELIVPVYKVKIRKLKKIKVT